MFCLQINIDWLIVFAALGVVDNVDGGISVFVDVVGTTILFCFYAVVLVGVFDATTASAFLVFITVNA